MRNKHPGTCYRCGNRVEVGEGHFEKIATGWRVQHASCAIKFRGTNKCSHSSEVWLGKRGESVLACEECGVLLEDLELTPRKSGSAT